MDSDRRIAALLGEQISLEMLSEALDALGPTLVSATLRRRESQVVWALQAEPSVQFAVEVLPGGCSSVWEASLTSALHSARGVHLARAILPGGLDGFDCLLIEPSQDASAPLCAMTDWLLGHHRRLCIDPRRLADLGPLEAWREACSLVFRGVLDEVDARVRRRFGPMGPEVVAHRIDLDGQAAIHHLSERIDVLSRMLDDAWGTPGWVAPQFNDD